MKSFFRTILASLIAFILVFLDVYFFSFLPLGGVPILSSFLVVLALAMTYKTDWFLSVSLSLVIFFSIFSSLPSFFILIIYIFIPLLVIFLRKSYFQEPSLFFSFFYFFPASLAAGLLVISGFNQISKTSLFLVLLFSMLNTVVGLAIYAIFKRFSWQSLANNKPR